MDDACVSVDGKPKAAASSSEKVSISSCVSARGVVVVDIDKGWCRSIGAKTGVGREGRSPSRTPSDDGRGLGTDGVSTSAVWSVTESVRALERAPFQNTASANSSSVRCGGVNCKSDFRDDVINFPRDATGPGVWCGATISGDNDDDLAVGGRLNRHDGRGGGLSTGMVGFAGTGRCKGSSFSSSFICRALSVLLLTLLLLPLVVVLVLVLLSSSPTSGGR
jgi:hypothetical protein